MQKWQMLLLIGILTGCSSTPVELPEWDIPEANVQAQYPLSLPERPPASIGQSGNAEFTQAGMLQLQRYAVTSETNFTIAQANAEALEAQSRAYNSLIDAGKMQHQVAQIREELLEIERRDHATDNWFYRGIIALGIIVIANE